MGNLDKLTNHKNIISALAIDQRGALRKMLGENVSQLVSQELTPYASSILLDPEFGLPASKKRDSQCGLILAYEKTGYDATSPGRLPDLIDGVSVKRLKEAGADAIKLLVYVDVDEDDTINDIKKAFVERVGSECAAEDLPLFLELVSYDAKITNKEEYAAIKPHKVIEAMKIYSDPRFNVAVLKVEIPVDMNYVEGFDQGQVIYSQEEAASYYKEQSKATNLPYIFLSAGVSAEMFRDTLAFAKESGSTFNGVLCGRATWAGGTQVFKEYGSQAAIEWFHTQGKKNILELASLVEELATPIQ